MLPLFDSQSQIPVMERFYTLQGEGFNSGKPAFFIRTAGCNVGCTWCDVKESWTAQQHQVESINTLMDEIQEANAKHAVITGGEPCMYNLEAITAALEKNKVSRWIETSGAYELTGTWDWVVISPKKFKKPLDSVLLQAHELKVVVCTKHDFRWAEQHAAKVNSTCKLYLQPEWDRRNTVQPLIIDYIKQHPQWQLSQQTHKYLDIP